MYCIWASRYTQTCVFPMCSSAAWLTCRAPYFLKQHPHYTLCECVTEWISFAFLHAHIVRHTQTRLCLHVRNRVMLPIWRGRAGDRRISSEDSQHTWLSPWDTLEDSHCSDSISNLAHIHNGKIWFARQICVKSSGGKKCGFHRCHWK